MLLFRDFFDPKPSIILCFALSVRTSSFPFASSLPRANRAGKWSTTGQLMEPHMQDPLLASSFEKRKRISKAARFCYQYSSGSTSVL
jgi:hypothetical protein